MDHLVSLQMLVERQAVPALMNNQMLEIVTRNAEAKYKPPVFRFFLKTNLSRTTHFQETPLNSPSTRKFKAGPTES